MTPTSRLVIVCLSLLVQYSLVISITVHPLAGSGIVRGQEQRTSGNGPGVPKSAVEADEESAAPVLEKVRTLNKQSGRLNAGLRDPKQPAVSKPEGAGSLAETVMGFGSGETAQDLRLLIEKKWLLLE
jgi:hypothetical protein